MRSGFTWIPTCDRWVVASTLKGVKGVYGKPKNNMAITVDMPKLNPSAPRPLQRSYIDTEETPLACTSIQGVDPALTCSFTSFNATYDRLKIENIFPNGLEERDVVMIIEISSIYNPFST